MKRTCLILSATIMLIASTSLAGRGTNLSEVEFQFSFYGNQPVSILFELDTGRAIMMIPRSNIGDAELTYMANAVQELVSSKKPVPLSGGYTIEFGTGFPVWGPHAESGPNYERECLMFAEGTTICGKRIIVNGTSSKPHFDGYTWWLNEHQ
ncbi:MAG: hypothetical protein WCV69_02860 [Patescibacteria group bacterium]|jgi:hypothetical protein